MRKQISIALAAGLLAAGVSAASAAETQKSTTTMAQPASDTLSMTSAQQKTVWNDLHGQATEQKAPSGFNAAAGAVVPSSVKTEPIPTKAATDVPALKSFNFAMVNGKLLIVNPTDKKIVQVISG
jgi:Protein of unknown function (DUF1236)